MKLDKLAEKQPLFKRTVFFTLLFIVAVEVAIISGLVR